VWQRTVVYYPAIAGKIDFDRGRTKLPPSQEPWPTAGRAHFSFKETVVKKTAIALALTLLAAGVYAQEKTIKVAGFGAKSGVVRSFGINSEAAMLAAADQINKAGGVTLADGSKAKFAIEYYDDRCNAEEGISVIRRIAGTDALVAVGPTCSNVAEPLFGILQKKAGDASDSGLQMPVFTDVAIKVGLAKISEWAFRNVPNEGTMYGSVFQWLKTKYPDAKTIYGGVEEDFAHSRASWYLVMKEKAAGEKYEVLGESKWLLADTNFSNQVREMKKANADIVAISAHPFTTCGVLKEMQRQGVKPKVLIGLTSSSSLETLEGCGKQAEGIIIPTSFAPISKEGVAAAQATAKFKGSADLHSMAAWENMFILKQVMESEKISGDASKLQDDRRKVRDGLAKLKETQGLLGVTQRSADREADKPYLFVHAKDNQWQVLYKPQGQ
jgi:branched-chain amino acid transport system substrate-binding protein